MKVLITGATGFVGSHLADLLTDEGHEVFSLVRNLDKAREFDVKGAFINGSLSHNKSSQWIEELPEDLDAVVHTAGIVHSFSTSDFFTINTECTRQLIKDLTPRFTDLKFVMISSLAAAGPSDNNQTETDLPLPVSEYGRSKLMAENIVRNETPNSWDKIIIRPPMVIGPRDPAILDVFKMVKNGIVPSVGLNGGEKLYSFIAVFDLTQTIKLSLECKTEATELFYSSHPNPIKFNELLNTIASELGKRPPFIFPLPVMAVRMATNLLALAKPSSVRLTPDKINEIVPKAWTCSSAKSSELLKQEYKWDLERIIKTTLVDYQERSWL